MWLSPMTRHLSPSILVLRHWISLLGSLFDHRFAVSDHRLSKAAQHMTVSHDSAKDALPWSLMKPWRPDPSSSSLKDPHVTPSARDTCLCVVRLRTSSKSASSAWIVRGTCITKSYSKDLTRLLETFQYFLEKPTMSCTRTPLELATLKLREVPFLTGSGGDFSFISSWQSTCVHGGCVRYIACQERALSRVKSSGPSRISRRVGLDARSSRLRCCASGSARSGLTKTGVTAMPLTGSSEGIRPRTVRLVRYNDWCCESV